MNHIDPVEQSLRRTIATAIATTLHLPRELVEAKRKLDAMKNHFDSEVHKFARAVVLGPSEYTYNGELPPPRPEVEHHQWAE